MADLAYHHGVKVVESPDTPSLLRVSNFGITFVNGTAPGADPAQFPLNTPTLVTSLAGASGLGAAGSLQADVAAILNEGGSYVIVNRVEHSETPSEMAANLIGDPVAGTGIFAALKAKPLLGVVPRVIVTAGDTGTFIEDGVVSVSLTASGDEYTEAPTVSFSGGSPDNRQLELRQRGFGCQLSTLGLFHVHRGRVAACGQCGLFFAPSGNGCGVVGRGFAATALER